MKVIIPVAGAGTRMQPHTFSVAKSLIPVADKPVLAHVLDRVAQLDPEHITFVIGHLGEQIVEWADEHCLTPHSFVDQPKLLGLGYATLLGLEEMESGPVVVILGDTVVEGDMRQFVATGDNVVGVCQVDNPTDFGIAELNEGRIVDLCEKPAHPRSDLALIGAYAFSDIDPLRETLRRLHKEGRRTRGEFQLTDALQEMIAAGEVFVPYRFDHWLDCGQPEALLEANRVLLEGLPQPELSAGIKLSHPVYIARSADVTDSEIGPYARIGEHCVVRNCRIENSIISDQVRLEDSTLEGSLIGSGALVRHQSGQVNVGKNAVLDGDTN